MANIFGSNNALGRSLTFNFLTMEKFPFSNAGFQALQQQLYLLNDADLQATANTVFNHFNNWMFENFELSASQVGFIESLNPKMTTLLASQTAMAMVNRLPINLIKPDSQMNTLLRGSKLIRPEAKVAASSEGEEGFEMEGNLNIEITY
ncbi:MAG: hypothetical protein EOO42_14005 [Flavobacteriales bacterium]|nr:MAG: hypothetical protein EOO42_14005 [Flavobacteriales bacterium]